MNIGRLKRFWTAEEVPRWIGLALVAILLFGMTGIAYWSAASTSEREAQASRTSSSSAVQLLAWTLSRIDPSDTVRQQGALRAFAVYHRCEELRVHDASGVVSASIDPNEIGERIPGRVAVETSPAQVYETHDLPSDQPGIDRWLVTAPIARVMLSPDGAQPPVRSVRCVLSAPSGGGLRGAQLGVAAIFVMAVGTFGMVYRLMRRHFRSLSRIRESLMLRGDQWEQDLAALRLSDDQGALATQWNRLIDLVDELSAGARRATATLELKEAIERSRGGELEDVVNAIPDGVVHVVDRDQLSYANAMACRVMGLPSAEGDAGPRGALDSLNAGPTGARIIERIRGALDADGSFRSETAVVDVDGGASSYRVRVLPFTKGNHRGACVVTITDISQQMRSDRAAEEFVSQVTHELRTPLTNIRAYAETLSSGVFDDPQVISDCYNVITKETRRLSRLIEDILSMSQLEVGSLQLRVDEVDLRSLLTDAVRDLRGLADEKHVDMQITLPSKLPEMTGDRDKLAVVMNNLLGNALKYTPSGGTIQIGCQASAEAVLVTVKDSGIGIDAVDHERIFEKFQRGSAAEVEEITGTGIGLTTAREIVRRHGGDIEVMSTKGEGATFVVHLPLRASRGSRRVGAVAAER